MVAFYFWGFRDMKDLLNDLLNVRSIQDLDNVKSKWLGKKSVLKSKFDSLKNLSLEDRYKLGQELNEQRKNIESLIEQKKKEIIQSQIESELKNDTFDITLPGELHNIGSLHPVTIIEEKCIKFFRCLGFSVVSGPEIETPEYNFDLLNIPKHHPARDMQDTFWIEKEKVLTRTHTTSVQSRFMMSLKGDESKLPAKIISPGRVYRNEAVDSTHLAIFNQFEGLWVEKGIKFANLKGIIEYMLKNIYGNDKKIRFKPKYYPYTEPSIGADILTSSGWVTVVGAGMISPKVLSNFGFDPEKISGFAFGFGTSRLACDFTGANMRELYGMDLRVLKNIKGIK